QAAAVGVALTALPTATPTLAPTLTATATPRPVNTSTPTRRPTPSPTRTPTTNPIAREIEEIQRKPVNFQDDFTQNDAEWSTISDEESRQVVEQGVLKIEVKKPSLKVWSSPSNANNLVPADFFLEINSKVVRAAKESDLGIIFRQVDNDNYYTFTYSPDGFFRLDKRLADEWEELLPWTTSSAIQSGTNFSNQLGILADGQDFTLIINDTIVAQVTDVSFRSGQIGLTASAFDAAEVEAHFDDLKLWLLSAGIVRVVSESLNVRSGPGTNYSRISSVNRGDELVVVGQTNNCDWLQVVLASGGIGWVSGGNQYVSIAPGCGTIPQVSASSLAAAPSPSGNSGSQVTTQSTAGGQSCYIFRNRLNAELTLTFTKKDGNWNTDFRVPSKQEVRRCFDPGKYTYTADLPPPWGSGNYEIEFKSGEERILTWQ
nr:SH3 domain-containing protein [Caldilineaceae bacterium]